MIRCDTIAYKLEDPAYINLIKLAESGNYMSMNQVFEENGLKFRFLTKDTAEFYIVDSRKYILFKIKFGL